MSKSSAAQFLVKVDGIAGYWMTKTGGNVSADTSLVYDGGKKQPDVVSGTATSDDMTVTRIFDPDLDGPIKRDMKNRVGSFRTTVSVTPTDPDLVPVDQPAVYSNAVLKGVNEPDVDAGSSDPAPWGLVFAVPNWS